MSETSLPASPQPEPAATAVPDGRRTKWVIPPTPGEVITSEMTRNSYTMGQEIGEGHFGRVFSCVDVWGNELVAKVMKPLGSYEKVKASTEAEFQKLLLLRHPNITYLYDAFLDGTESYNPTDMIHIIGVAHRVQCKAKDKPETDEQKAFRVCLSCAIELCKPVLIAEEFSAFAVAQLRRETGADHESVAKMTADSLKVEHRFCDPEPEARRRMGYREGSDLALEILRQDTNGISNAELNDRGFAIEVAKYWPLREQFWLDQLHDVRDREVVFVCGDAHVEGFQELLKRNGTRFDVISRHIGVTSGDDEFWIRVMAYLGAHPELRA